MFEWFWATKVEMKNNSKYGLASKNRPDFVQSKYDIYFNRREPAKITKIAFAHENTRGLQESFLVPFISICSQFLQISSCFSSRSTNCEWTLKLYIAHHQLTVYSILTVSFPLIEPCLTVSYKTAQEEYVTGKAPDGSGLQLGRTSLEPAGSMWHFHGVW